MPPARSESASVVSMPPREKRLAKRRAQALKQGLGLPPSIAGQIPDKQAQKKVLPTLAATRERRAGANRAYLVRPNGIRIKRVAPRSAPGPVPHVPYLPGQEDIPHSDDESGGPDYATASVSAIAKPHASSNYFNIADEADDLLDYDAEGEDDDEYADADMDIDTYGSSSAGGLDHPSDGSSWNYPLAGQPVNLLANASEEDVCALFSGFDSLRFDEDPASLETGDFNFSGDFNTFDPPVPYLQNSVDVGFGYQPPMSSTQQSFIMDQVNATANISHPHALSPTEIPSPPAANSAVPHPPLPALRRVPTPAPWFMTPEIQFPTPAQPPSIVHVPRHQPTPLPPVRQPTPRIPASRVGTPLGRPIPSHRPPAFSRPRPPTSTSERASQARSEARGSRRPPSAADLASPASISLSFTESGDEDGDSDSGSDAPRASTPVEYGDTDIGLTEFSVLPANQTQSQCRAALWLNLQTPRPASQPVGSRIAPTYVELQSRAKEHVMSLSRKTRFRGPNPTAPPSNGRGPLRSWELTPEQNVVMGPMEYHVYKDLVFADPWPNPAARDAFLDDAKDYSVRMTGTDGEEVYTRRFRDTVYSRMSANRGNTHAKVEVMVQQELAISAADKPEIQMYLDKHNFLYPTIDRDQNQKFRVHIIGSAILIILFECGKQLGRVFMEELNQPDDARKCADWHGKVRDRTARGKGIPPGLIAYAATQIHWALLKLKAGGSVHFSEIQFREVWAHYLRSLLNLKHLGTLRLDLLELVQNRYMDKWPGAERDEDDEDSYPAW